MKITTIAYDSREYHEMLALRHMVLRAPWGLCFTDADLQKEKEDVFIAYYDAGQITGCCILTKQNSDIVKLRQMAVHPDWQGKNTGTKILEFAERYATESGYMTIVLHARVTASRFYEKCGYVSVDGIFTEIGMPHIVMKKILR